MNNNSPNVEISVQELKLLASCYSFYCPAFIDGFVKSPTSVLRYILCHCSVI